MTQVTQDWPLLREYVERGSEQAFAKLVASYVDMVYSAALRQVRRRDLAEEVTQVVFIILARKASTLKPDVMLPAWLHKTARYTAANVLKVQARRTAHERKAAQMAADYLRVDSSWEKLSPVLDEGIARLNERERAAILLRFFQHKSLAETGQALGVSEDAAGMRVSRALEKLRAFFRSRGVAMPAAALGGVISANSVHAAPAAFKGVVAAGAFGALHGSAGAATAAATQLSLADAVWRGIVFAKAKFAALVVCAILSAGVGSFLVANYLVVPIWQRVTHSPQRQQEGGTSMTSADPLATWNLPSGFRPGKS
jgi:RNA polymerase sigma factor (sigma-70 family)